MALPAGSYAFKSVTIQRYLLYRNEHNALHDILEFTGNNHERPEATFLVGVDAQFPDLVNIQSSNDCYWKRPDNINKRIVSDAHERHEDQDVWNCTLFRPVKIDDGRYRFQHVQLGRYIQPYAEGNFQALVNAHTDHPNDDQILEVIPIQNQP